MFKTAGAVSVVLAEVPILVVTVCVSTLIVSKSPPDMDVVRGDVPHSK